MQNFSVMPTKASETGSSPKGRTNTSFVFDYRPDVPGYIPPRRNCLGRLRLVVMPFFAILGEKHPISCRMGVSPLRNLFILILSETQANVLFATLIKSWKNKRNPNLGEKRKRYSSSRALNSGECAVSQQYGCRLSNLRIAVFL